MITIDDHYDDFDGGDYFDNYCDYKNFIDKMNDHNQKHGYQVTTEMDTNEYDVVSDSVHNAGPTC